MNSSSHLQEIKKTKAVWEYKGKYKVQTTCSGGNKMKSWQTRSK